MTGRILEIQRFRLHDGPGLRTTVLLKGCRLHCAWCPRPEAIEATPELLIDNDACVACRACVLACPHAAADADTPLDIGRRCLVCGLCVTACPRRVRRIAGEAMHVETILPLLLRDREQYGSDGGVTFGGGEPLAQWDFVRQASDRLCDACIHVAVETPCVAPDRVIQLLPTTVNLVLARLALIDPDRHRQWLGGDNRAILESIAYLAGAMPGRLWLRIPLVPGVHDVGEIRRLAAFVAGLPNQVLVSLEPCRAAPGEKHYLAQRSDPPRFTGEIADLTRIARGLFLQHGACLLEA